MKKHYAFYQKTASATKLTRHRFTWLTCGSLKKGIGVVWGRNYPYGLETESLSLRAKLFAMQTLLCSQILSKNIYLKRSESNENQFFLLPKVNHHFFKKNRGFLILESFALKNKNMHIYFKN